MKSGNYLAFLLSEQICCQLVSTQSTLPPHPLTYYMEKLCINIISRRRCGRECYFPSTRTDNCICLTLFSVHVILLCNCFCVLCYFLSFNALVIAMPATSNKILHFD